jgi:hypothetical protein
VLLALHPQQLQQLGRSGMVARLSVANHENMAAVMLVMLASGGGHSFLRMSHSELV